MKPADFTKIHGRLLHPDYRGRGYAQLLLGAVARRGRGAGKR